MGKESLYRRSFHCDGDLKSMEKMLELEKALSGKKANVDKLRVPSAIDGGFEAPRNSLDVPAAGFMERRRHSEVRCEDIPIGYELSRSLTTRRRNDDSPAVRKSMSAIDPILLRPRLLDKGNADPDQKPRPSSVVARLMGLDPLPHEREAQAHSELSSKRVLPHEFFMSEREPSITKQPSVRVLLQRDTTSIKESLSGQIPAASKSSKVLPFRKKHPQEKQLQEFKKEFAVHQGKVSTPVLPKADMQLGMHMEKRQPHREEQDFRREGLQESQEFLDALDFLQSNKEFFSKVLKDPSSLFGKQLQHTGGASKEGLGHIKVSKPTRGISESKTDARQVSSGSGIDSFGTNGGPYIRLPQLPHKSTKSNRTTHLECPDKEPFVVRNSRLGQDEHMPQRRPQPGSPPTPRNDQSMPTKIVVLRPKLGNTAKSRPSTTLSPPSDMFDAAYVKARLEGRDAAAKWDINEGLRCEPSAAARNHLKAGLQDAGDIARHIVEQVKEDMSRRLSIEISQPSEVSSLGKSSSRGRRVPPQRGGAANGDSSGASDGEGYCPSSRRMTRDSVRANVSLPSSPRLSRSEPGVDSKPFGDKSKRGGYGEKKMSWVPSSANTCRDVERDNVGGGRGSAVQEAKQDRVKNPKPLSSTRRGRNRPGSFNYASEPSKALQRSLSAPAVENRALKHEQKGSMHANSLACSSNSRIAENSLFKEKLLSLKGSLSLSKKKSFNKQGTPRTNPPELGSPSHLTDVPGVEASCSTMPSVYAWRATSLLRDQKDEPFVEGCSLDDGVFMKSKSLSGVRQWAPSAGDLLDSASDVSLEKSEQPSPISVLVTPFDEESPSPEQSSSTSHDGSLRISSLELDYKKRLLDLHEASLSSSTSRQSSFNSVIEDTSCDSNGVHMPLETLSMCGIVCASGAEDELICIRDLLAFAGFTNTEYVKAHAFSKEHGFNPSMFEKMESYYASMKGTVGHTPLDPSSRRMLFDVVDEILSWILGVSTSPLDKQEKLGFLVAHTGKDLLEQIWKYVCNHRYTPSEYSEDEILDALASKDLMEDASWVHSQTDMEAVALELEKLVCGDLIREMTHEVKQKLLSA